MWVTQEEEYRGAFFHPGQYSLGPTVQVSVPPKKGFMLQEERARVIKVERGEGGQGGSMVEAWDQKGVPDKEENVEVIIAITIVPVL